MSECYEIRETGVYRRWIRGLRDSQARQRINIRLRRVALGNFGDVRPVGSGVSELRIDFGPGYRIYFATRRREIMLLLVGGDKGSQQRDIRLAQELASRWDDEDGA